MTKRRWSDSDDRLMVEGAGTFALAWFLARLKSAEAKPRTRSALYHRARQLWGGGGLRRGVYSMRSIAEDTGYHPDQIHRAQSALNHRYKRLTPKGAYLISYDQREDVVAWLAHDFWSKHLRVYRCLWCNQTKRPHHAMGLCGCCYKAMTRLCKRLGLPTTCEGMAAHVVTLPIPIDSATALLERLARGWTLERNWLITLSSVKADT